MPLYWQQLMLEKKKNPEMEATCPSIRQQLMKKRGKNFELFCKSAPTGLLKCSVELGHIFQYFVNECMIVVQSVNKSWLSIGWSAPGDIKHFCKILSPLAIFYFYKFENSEILALCWWTQASRGQRKKLHVKLQLHFSPSGKIVDFQPPVLLV